MALARHDWRKAVLARFGARAATTFAVAFAISEYATTTKGGGPDGGAFVPGTAYPGTSRLARELGVSEATVKRAVRALVTDGFVRPRANDGKSKRSFSRCQPVSLVNRVHARHGSKRNQANLRAQPVSPVNRGHT